MRSATWVMGVVGAAGVLGLAHAAENDDFAKVAEYGDHAVGLPPAVTYSATQMPMVDGTGTFLFASQLDGGSPAIGISDSGVFVGKRGALQLVAHAGDVAPGAGGAVWSNLLPVGWILRANGRVAFPGEIDGADSAHDGGIWAGTVGNLALVAREGDPAPGTTVAFASANNNFQDGPHLAMNDAGAVAFRAKLAGQGVTTSNDQALYAGTPGALTLVGRLGGAAPDAGGATFAKSGSESFTPPSINTSGQILFRGHLAGTGVTPTNADAIWLGSPASLSIAIRSGDAVAGTAIPQGSTLIGLGAEPPVLNDAGAILFESSTFNGAELRQSVWYDLQGTLTPVAVSGQPVPGDSKAANFAGLYQHLRMNATGQAAFHALLSSSATDWALVGWDGANLRELARTGDQAPGMPLGETFDGVATEAVSLNAAGKVLFRHVTSPSVIQGVWLGDVTTGTVQLIARTGVQATVGGVSRQVIDLTIYNGPDTAGSTQDGRSSPLGDDGTYAILAQFLDGHLAVLTNAGPAGGTAGDVTPSTVSLGTSIEVTGSGFGGGAAKFKAPSVWLTVPDSSSKYPLKVDASTASDTDLHATVKKLPKGISGAATLHVQPKVKGAAVIDAPLTIGLPSVTSVSVPAAAGGELVTLTGTHFGSKKGHVLFFAFVGDESVRKRVVVKSWSDTSITVVVPKIHLPADVTSAGGSFEVDNVSGESNAAAFTVNG